jgi:anti-sigma-K factor RskA
MTTASEVQAGKAEQEAVAAEIAVEALCRQERTCASSVTLAASTASTAVTQRVRTWGQFAARKAALLDKPGSLVHAQPPTFKQARDRHHECADHFKVWRFLRVLRLAWGYFHMLVIKPALNLAEWVTESPLRLTVTAAVAGAVWIWS